MEANKQYEQYAAFKEKQTELAGMLGEASDVIADLNMQQFRDNLKKLSDKVQNDSFKVQIVGTFKNGKSTFINSLLGEEVLPAYALPCTAVVNEVKWGEEKKAIVHFRNPLPDKLPSGIPEKAKQHMQKFNMKDIPPIEISYDEIEKYAVISIGHGKEELEYESPYEKIEVFWPLPILKNGVEIIDSPGLNECATRTRVTMNYISKADAILFVLDATRILSADEMRVIEHTLKEQGFDDPFIIVNKFDAIRNREKDQMRQYVRDKLDGYTTNDFFFVSALNALDGKLDDDEDLLKSSGMPEFEKALSAYLTKQKGKAKLSQPTRELKRILNEEALFKTIPMQRTALASSLDGLKEKYEKVKPRLDDLRTKKEQLLNRLMLRIEQVKPEFRRMMSRNIVDLADKIPVWIEEFEPQTKIGLIPNKETLGVISQEISGYVNERIEDTQLEWRKNVLEPVISEKTEDVFGSVETDLEKFFAEIDSISVDVTGQEYDTNSVPTWQRIAGVIGGLALSDVGIAISGGINGFSKEFAKSFALEVGAIALLNVLGFLNPVTIIATLAGLFFYNKNKSQGIAMKKLKEQIQTEIINQLSNNAEDNSTRLANNIGVKYSEIAQQITNAMDTEINETESQINGIIAEMEKGKENIAKREKIIADCETKIKDLSIRLDDLIRRLMEA